MKKLTLAPNGGFICCVTPFVGQKCPDCQEFFANPKEALGISAVAEELEVEERKATLKKASKEDVLLNTAAAAVTAVDTEAAAEPTTPAAKPAKQPKQPKQPQ